MTQAAALLMDYGSPATTDDVEAFYTHIRHGKPPTQAELDDLRRRYDAIGGISPLADRSESQRAAIEAALERREPGRWKVALGHKHAPPFLEEAVELLASDQPAVVVGLVLAPHYSRASVGEYHRRAAAAAESAATPYRPIESWHLDEAYLDFCAGAIRRTLDGLPDRTKVLFTAHSLPERALVGDPYPDQLWEGARAAAARAGLAAWASWSLAWQSAPPGAEAWQGPDVRSVISELGATGRADGVAVCPHGFVSDHLEVRYDLDMDAAAVAADAGLDFGRTDTVDDDPDVMAALAERLIAGAAP